MDMIATGVKLPDAPEKTAQGAAPVATPKPPAPVMDVKPPTPENENGVHAAPPEETPPATEAPKNEKPAKKAKPAKVKKPKGPRQPGVGLAIFASTVIVLGLATLAVYAYLKSNDIPVF